MPQGHLGSSESCTLKKWQPGKQPSTSTELKPGCIKSPHTFISKTLQQPLTLGMTKPTPLSHRWRWAGGAQASLAGGCPSSPSCRAAQPSWSPGEGSLQVLAPNTACCFPGHGSHHDTPAGWAGRDTCASGACPVKKSPVSWDVTTKG